MSLSEIAKAGPPVPEKRLNGLTSWLQTLEPTDLEAALGMLNDPAWKNKQLHESFATYGLSMSFSHFVRLRAERAWE